MVHTNFPCCLFFFCSGHKSKWGCVAFVVTSVWCRLFYFDSKVIFVWRSQKIPLANPDLSPHYIMHGVTQTLCLSPLYFPWRWSLLTTLCIYGSPSTLFLSGSQQSGPTSSNFPLVLLLISTQSHMWDVTAVDGPGQRASTLCCCVSVCMFERVCGVKGAIHEQLAGVKSGKGRAAVYDCWVYLCVFVSVNVCVHWLHVCSHMSVTVRLYLTLMWSQQSECLTFTSETKLPLRKTIWLWAVDSAYCNYRKNN